MSITSLVITIAVLAIFGYMGWLRPTSLAGRTRAEREKENKQDVADKWLNKDSE